MDILGQIINSLSLHNKSFGDFELLGFSINKNNSEFESTVFTLLDNNGGFFARVHIAKRIVVAFAQNLLKKRNIMLLPEFVDTTSLMLISEILNRLEEQYQIHLEISPNNLPMSRPTTDILLSIKYQKIFAPVIIKTDTEQLIKLLFQMGIIPEDTLEFKIGITGERNFSLRIIGSLKEGDYLKIPKTIQLTINNQFRIADKEIFYEEEKMENIIKLVEEIEIPVTFKIDLGIMPLTKIRDFLTNEKLSEFLNGKKCRLIISNSIIAEGEFNENQVRITKIFI